MLLLPLQLNAQESELLIPTPDGGSEAWLVTYAPGEIYWQRFGHNAIWIRDPGMGIDHSFNFGYFDFNQENFIGDFLRLAGKIENDDQTKNELLEMLNQPLSNRTIRKYLEEVNEKELLNILEDSINLGMDLLSGEVSPETSPKLSGTPNGTG